MMAILLNPVLFIVNLLINVWLSISSISFYEKILKKKDYGLLYILNLSLLSALVCTVFLLCNMHHIQQYLKNNILSKTVINMDFILNKIPPIEYNGQEIISSRQMPLVIQNQDKVNVLAIDPNNQIPPGTRYTIPVIVTKKQIIIKLLDYSGDIKSTFPIELNTIFHKIPRMLTNQEIKFAFSQLLEHSTRIIIYMIFPLTGLLIFLNTFLNKAFFIIIIFFLSKIINIYLSIKTCIRLAMYTSGFYTLFQCTVIFFTQEYSSIMWIIQGWSNILMILGILKTKGLIYYS